jgi:hypothetical protein
MKSFYCIHKRYWLPARHYKVYIRGDQLLFGRMPGSKNEDITYSDSIIASLILEFIDSRWVKPRIKRKEIELDSLISKEEQFLAKRKNFALSLQDISSVKFRHIDPEGVLFIKTKKGEELELHIDGNFNKDDVIAIFEPLEVKYTTYFW